LKKYQIIRENLKQKIQQGEYVEGDLLPSENELCSTYSITRTTARKALDELLKEGFIERKHGKGSVVRERRKSLGLLNVKGFSDAVGENVRTVFLKKPAISPWSSIIHFKVSEHERKAPCIYFERLRYVGNEPVMLESNWIADFGMTDFIENQFVEGSFFRTLSRNYSIEIVGSEHELRAEFASKEIADLLQIGINNPVLHISVKFKTSRPKLSIYSELYCNTTKYPIGNTYNI